MVLAYICALVAFMLKGLPALVFLGISLIACAVFFKKPKRLFSIGSILGAIFLILNIGAYLFFVSKEVSLSDFIANLWNESSKRTVLNKSILTSIKHIFTFPLQFVVDLLPWSLLALVFVGKNARKMVKENRFLRYCLVIFACNIIIYWLSPDNRARYIFSLYPLFIIPTMYCMIHVHLSRAKRTISHGLGLIIVLCPFIMVAGFFIFHQYLSGSALIYCIVIIMTMFLLFSLYKHPNETMVHFLLLVIIARFGFNLIAIPERSRSGVYAKEKQQAGEIIRKTGDDDLSYLLCNVNNTMAWYLTINKKEIIPIVRDSSLIDKDDFYLVPVQNRGDTSLSTTHFKFTRRFGKTPFELVKYKESDPYKILKDE